MTYLDEYRAQVAALDATLAAERGRRRIHGACTDCHQPESACSCNPTPPDLGDGPDRAGHNYYEGP